MPDLKCCCHSSDARDCIRLRYGRAFDEDGSDNHDPDDGCECVCHQADQDGYTEWDDRNLPVPMEMDI